MSRAANGQIDRYLHLGEATVTEGQRVRRGDAIGVIAEAHESGSGEAPTFTLRSARATTTERRRTTDNPSIPSSRWCDGIATQSRIG